METILDHRPTPFELHHLGYTDDATTPLTDECRAKCYLERLPADDLMRRAEEELRAEWSILKH
jgi:hypothetical protein